MKQPETAWIYDLMKRVSAISIEHKITHPTLPVDSKFDCDFSEIYASIARAAVFNVLDRLPISWAAEKLDHNHLVLFVRFVL